MSASHSIEFRIVRSPELKNFSGCFFPAAGNRNNDGNANNRGNNGNYWSPRPNNNNAYNLNFNNGNASVDCGCSRAYGFSVRCVQE